MKKICSLIFITISLTLPVFGQITGDGSSGNPYSGTITNSSQNFAISGAKYFNQIDVSGGSLTISAGATLYARNSSSYITISSNGNLNAIGTTGNQITITADNNGDGAPDGSWKNLTFELCAVSSTISFANIERGTGNDGYGWGGGVFIYGGNITITNTSISNCIISGDGGGLYIYATAASSNNTIQNLKIHNNLASGNGGGLVIDGEVASTVTGSEINNNLASLGDGVYFLYTGTITNSLIHSHNSGEGIYVNSATTASISNCLVYGNTTGIYFSGSGNSINCNIINNTTGIRSPNNPAPKIVNSILWGNTTQYIASGGLELAYCGIQGGLSGGTDGGGNKTLSATNGADSGPNFVSTSAPVDYHLNAWISPCVDGGASSYGSLPIPTNDLEGKSRISTLDIGAFEFTYYIWTGTTSTDWLTSSNWVGSPSVIPISISDNKVIIPKGKPNYPTVSSLSLSTRSILTMEPQSGLKVTGSTTIGTGCTFTLESDATGSANFIPESSVTGDVIVKLFLAGGGNPNYKWHYVTTPVDNYSKTALTTDINNNYDLLDYRENVVATDKAQGWNWHDGYSGTSGFSDLVKVRGYNVYIASDQTATFTSTSSTPLQYSDFTNSSITAGSGDPNVRGWNLIGNPFTSAVNANNFILSNRIVDKSIYFTKDNLYLTWNTALHDGTGQGVSNVVLPLQGFFVHAVSTPPGTKSVLIPASSRIYTTNALYKGSQPNSESQKGHTYPILKFNISDGASLYDDAIIFFFSDATTAFDSDYDAYKLFSENPVYPQIYTKSDGINFSMNAFPTPVTKTTIPVNIRIGEPKTYNFNVVNLENLSEYSVTLIHGLNRIDLKTNPTYSFPAINGTITDMAIEFSLTTEIAEKPKENETSAFWYSNGILSIKIGQDGFENRSVIHILDITGREIYTDRKTVFTRGEIINLPVLLNQGIFIVNITGDQKKIVKKIVVSR